MDEFVWIALIVGAVFLTPIILSIVALNKAERVSRELFKLRNELSQLRSQDVQTVAVPAATPEPEPEPAAAAKKVTAKSRIAAKVANDDVVKAPLSPEEQPVKPKAARSSLEENLAGRWFIWIGGLAIALSGLFLVKYMADNGLLGPGMRVMLGLVCGGALTVAGEWLRRHPSQQRLVSDKPDYVPQALSAGGLAGVFAAVYAASALYGFIGPVVTLVALAATALVAFSLSVVQGPMTAIVGLLGGFLLPMFMASADPFAPGLFGYFAILFIAVCAVLIYRQALWFALLATVLSGLWVLVWVVGPFEAGPGQSYSLFGDGLVLALFSVLAGTGYAFADGYRSADAQPALWHKPWWPKEPMHVASFAASLAAVFLLLVVLVRDGYGIGSLLGLVVFAVACMIAAARAERFDFLALVAGLALLLGFSAWGARLHLEGWLEGWIFSDRASWSLDPTEEARSYLRYSMIVGAGALIAGYWQLWRSVRPWVWATFGTAVPIGLMVAAYATLRSLEPSVTWAFAGLALAAVFVALAARVRSAASHEEARLALGIYAMAVCASVAMALAFVLRDAWLSASLAAVLAATGYIASQLQLGQLRLPALLIALAVLGRLFLNQQIFDYGQQVWLGRWWVVYGYGLPLLMFHLAFKLFGAGNTKDLLSKVLEGGRIALAAMFVSAIIRVAVAGGIEREDFSLLEAGLHSTSWLVSAAACWWRWSHHGGFIDKWAGRVLTAMGCGLACLCVFTGLNPIFDRQMVGNWPLVNALAPAYLLPALLAGFIGYTLRNHSVPRLLKMAWPPAVLAAMLLWLSMEVRRFFHAPDQLGSFQMPTSELYTYSAVWLLFAIALLAGGIMLQRAQLRYASLAVLVLVVLKVFLVDLSDLEGLLRVASFLGLGLCLVGIGFVYQRFVHKPQTGTGEAT